MLSCILDCENKHTIVKWQCKLFERTATLSDALFAGDRIALMIRTQSKAYEYSFQ